MVGVGVRWRGADAYRSLWSWLARHDLVGRIVWTRAPIDDPALELFVEPRLLNTQMPRDCVINRKRAHRKTHRDGWQETCGEEVESSPVARAAQRRVSVG